VVEDIERQSDEATRFHRISRRHSYDVASRAQASLSAHWLTSMETVDGGGASQEKAVFAPGAAAVRSTRVVNFHTGKNLHEVQRCHLNAAVFDSDWERQAADLLGSHPTVEAWVKNDRLGLVIPYRKEGTPRKYLPDFLVELQNGRNLIVEIKGQAGDAAIKKAAAERWCRAVSNDGRYGNWDYHLCFGANELMEVLD
jgi:type III restriction enzyme